MSRVDLRWVVPAGAAVLAMVTAPGALATAGGASSGSANRPHTAAAAGAATMAAPVEHVAAASNPLVAALAHLGPAGPGDVQADSKKPWPTPPNIPINVSCRKPADSAVSTAAGHGLPRETQKATDFTATTIDCKKVSFSGIQQGGHVTVISFYATWCPPCNQEGPDMGAFYAAHKADGLRMLGILSFDGPGSGSASEPHDDRGPYDFYTKYGWTFETVWDDPYQTETSAATGSGYKIADAYTISAIPTTQYIRADGTIAVSITNSETRAEMEQNYQCASETMQQEMSDVNCIANAAQSPG